MAKRQSFDEPAKGAGKAEAKGGGGESRGNMIKITVLVVALAAAGFLLARYFGVFDANEPPPQRLEDTTDAELKKALEESQKVNQKVEQIRKAPAGS